eukprot:TRINITY_DN28162_c0_g1_i1.p1 TRINITY_DN28162_c0_g1~~TRINITY_DN28162_c0_g1_i1.p1  ORF type:complete len:345 (+),score=47.42 TRINITY_DN28162_c0_g1_i1:99-1133(+)
MQLQEKATARTVSQRAHAENDTNSDISSDESLVSSASSDRFLREASCGDRCASCCRCFWCCGLPPRFGWIACLFGVYIVLIPVFYYCGWLGMYPGDGWEGPDAQKAMRNCDVVHVASELHKANPSQMPVLRCMVNPGKTSPQSVVLFGGNAMNMYTSMYSMPFVLPASRTYDVFASSYPGEQYGNPNGWASQDSMTKQAMSLMKHVENATGVPPVVFGWSIGTSVAAATASSYPAGRLKCVILGNPFTDMQSMVLRLTYYLTLPWLFVFDQWPTEKWASSIKAPTIVLSSTADQVIPAWMHNRVFEALPGASNDTEALLEEPVGHMDIEAFQDGLQDAFLRLCT